MPPPRSTNAPKSGTDTTRPVSTAPGTIDARTAAASACCSSSSRFRLDMYPFGGMKRSGVGREGVKYAIQELTQVKFTGIKL